MEKMSIFPTFKCAAAINFHHVQMLKINGGGIKVVENLLRHQRPTLYQTLLIAKQFTCLSIALLPSNA